MKVRVHSGDSVTYLDETARFVPVDTKGSKEKVVGKIVYKIGSCYSVHWLKPKLYRDGYSFVAESCLAVLLKRNDPRWKIEIHPQELKEVVSTPS